MASQFGPPDLQALLAQLMQQQQETRQNLFQTQDSGYGKVGAALGIGLGNLVQGRYDPKKSSTYQAAEQRSNLYQLLDTSNPDVLAQHAESLATVDPAFANQVRQEAERLKKDQLAAEAQRATIESTRASTDATRQGIDFNAQKNPLTIQQMQQDIQNKGLEQVKLEQQNYVGRMEQEVTRTLGSLPDDPAVWKRKAAQLQSSNPTMAAMIRMRADAVTEQRLAKSEFERLLADPSLTREERDILLKQRLESQASNRSSTTSISLTPQQFTDAQASLDSVNSNIDLIDTITTLIQNDPTLVGAGGALRRLMQNTSATVGSLSDVAELAPIAGPMIGMIKGVFSSVSGEEQRQDFAKLTGMSQEELKDFDPNVATMKELDGAFKFALARSIQGDSGKLLAASIKQAEQMGGILNMFSGAEPILAKLASTKQRLQDQAISSQNLIDYMAPNFSPGLLQSRGQGEEQDPGAGIDFDALAAERARRANAQ